MGNATYLGFDFGLKKIGVAVGQTISRSASALTVIFVEKEGLPWKKIDGLIATWKPQGLIVGQPLNMDGSRQNLTDLAAAFSQRLAKRYTLPVYEIDERLSSAAVRETVFAQGGYRALRKKPIDGLAAKLILEDWLNQHSEK